MEKFFKLATKLFLVLCAPLFLCSSILLNFFAEYFTIGIYGVLDTQRNFAENDCSYNRVLIIGDSIAQSAYFPCDLSADTYNLGIGNATPVDGYYRLCEYLENHPRPEFIFCSYSPSELIQQNGFWSTTMYERGITLKQALAIVTDAKNFSPDSGILRDNMQLQVLAYQYGFHIDSVKLVLNGILKNATQETCYENYCNQREWVSANRGHWKHYMAGGSGSDVYGVVSGVFTVSQMGDCYMRKIIDLCSAQGIDLIIEIVPINESSYKTVSPEFKESYELYWGNLSSNYPDITISSEMKFYEDSFFCDSLHFNMEGTKRFSNYIREKYSYIFEEAST